VTRTSPATEVDGAIKGVGTLAHGTGDVAGQSMTKSERDELAKLAKRRERTAKAGIEHRAAELLADVEAQLASTYAPSNELWAELTAEAKRIVDGFDAQIAERCRVLGVREEFRPHLTLGWYGRGQNGDAQRRTELRKVAQAQIVAESRRAKYVIEARTTDVLTELAAGALHSHEAKAFLATIPTAGELMPTLSVDALEAGR
jgi:hypothetical protein